MNFRDFLKNNRIILDGAMGSMLQARGLSAGEYPELWNVSHPDVIKEIHKSYFDAGSNVVATNTFGANSLKFSEDELEGIVKAAIDNAIAARESSDSRDDKFIALDIGPTGKLLKPLGELEFQDAVNIFSKTARFAEKYGADLVLIETMSDSYETKAALLAVKESTSLPVIVTNAYGSDGKLMTGASPSAMVAMLEGMGADAIGANCSLGPRELMDVVRELVSKASVPVAIKPNAGLPTLESGKTVYNVGCEEFSDYAIKMLELGVRAIGGCCGTTPEYIKSISDKAKTVGLKPITDKGITVVSSFTHSCEFGTSPLIIGERINPTGKKRFKEALLANDIDYILAEGLKQEECGAHILDVNVGLPGIDEAQMLTKTIVALQSVTDLPLQIDTADPIAMETALRIYNGKALINSVNGKAESMEKIFPLVKKYGGAVIALTLDESGIPETADGRVKIAQKILKRAEEWGISKKDIIFDTLTLTVSTDPKAASVTLEALRRIKYELGCHTSLGVSNVSFGLPARDGLNASFFTLALASGLSSAIVNPYSEDMKRAYYTYRALMGFDENFEEYIARADGFLLTHNAEKSTAVKNDNPISDLKTAIIKGLKEKARELAELALEKREALELIESEIIPALNAVGDGYEKRRVYLPSLIMSAESAGEAFEVIKIKASKSDTDRQLGEKIVMATVEGDIHDIGKNIVKLILQNYGYDVIDLGKDVSPQDILRAVIESKARIVGLSALMTTTLPAMEKTVSLLKAHIPGIKIMVGGAVLTKEHSEKIGADGYAKDAISAVKLAAQFVSELDKI